MASRIVLLAPAGASPSFGSTKVDPSRWRALFSEACQVRGQVYLKDGAVRESDLGSDGEFRIPLDAASWHMLMMNYEDRVASTLRITTLPLEGGKRKGTLPHIEESIHRSANDPWLARLTLERYLAGLGLAFGAARSSFFVVGGWATIPKLAPPGAGAELALCTWACARHIGAAGAICVASERHDAHGQLKRTGAEPIRAVNSQEMYFDSAYGCRVGILGFRVFQERRSLRRVVDQLSAKLRDCEVIVNS